MRREPRPRGSLHFNKPPMTVEALGGRLASRGLVELTDCLKVMSSNQSCMIRRWHSRELTRAYEEHVRAMELLH